MKERRFSLGIDLGTTNSVAAVFDGETCQVVRNAQGGTLTPSVVRVDARGNVSVGARARRHLESDPDNTRSEWKRLLGSSRTLTFGATGATRSPVELSAEILRSIRRDTEEQLGFAPVSAVITVPALFEVPQTSATAEAARLAGFERVELLQEPVASALAAGYGDESNPRPWLVYDLGGGTFDVSLVEMRDGLLRVVGHDGDNFLGGRDFDSAIVEHVLGEIDGGRGFALDRGDATHAAALRRLRVAVEEAKIELARSRQSVVSIDDWLVRDGAPIDIDVALDRATVERLTMPLVDRTLAVCRRLLDAHGIRDAGLSRVVLVGGPTVMPHLRQRVGEQLSAPFGTGLDPMTLVAQGAAHYAASLGLDARIGTRSSVDAPRPSSGQPSGPAVWLQYPAVSADLEPFVVGRLLDLRSGVAVVRVTRDDGGFVSEECPIDGDGTFAIGVALLRRRTSTFSIEGRTAQGEFRRLDPPAFSIQQGVTIGDPPLSRSIGVALADGGVRRYFERGAPLPIRRSFRHVTTTGITAGDPESVLRIPIVQGESNLARLCRLVGEIRIDGGRIVESLPAASDVDVTIELDRAGRLTSRAAIPSLGASFDEIATLVTPEVGLEQLESASAELLDRAQRLRRRAFRTGDPSTVRDLASVDATFAEIEITTDQARAGDADALEKCRRLLGDLDEHLTSVEETISLPELLAEIDVQLEAASHWVEMQGTESDRRLLVETARALERQRDGRRVTELERLRQRLRTLANTCYFRWPEAWSRELEHMASKSTSMSDARRADALVQRGRRAIERGDSAELRESVRALWALLPPSERGAGQSYDSGLR